MWFEIPKEHADTPEAKRLLELDAEFSEVCALNQKAVTIKQYEADPVAVEALSKRSRELQQAIKVALAAYDQATGEPKPVDLSPDVLQEIHRQFDATDCNTVIMKLSKTLGYLRRQGNEDPRIAKYILILANTSKERILDLADEAVSDFRNIIYWVENSKESRLDTPEKIENFQKLLEWLGKERDPQLEREKR